MRGEPFKLWPDVSHWMILGCGKEFQALSCIAKDAFIVHVCRDLLSRSLDSLPIRSMLFDLFLLSFEHFCPSIWVASVEQPWMIDKRDETSFCFVTMKEKLIGHLFGSSKVSLKSPKRSHFTSLLDSIHFNFEAWRLAWRLGANSSNTCQVKGPMKRIDWSRRPKEFQKISIGTHWFDLWFSFHLGLVLSSLVYHHFVKISPRLGNSSIRSRVHMKPWMKLFESQNCTPSSSSNDSQESIHRLSHIKACQWDAITISIGSWHQTSYLDVRFWYNKYKLSKKVKASWIDRRKGNFNVYLLWITHIFHISTL